MPRSPSQPTVALNAPPRPTLSLGHHRTLGKRVGVVGTGGLDHYAVLLGAARRSKMGAKEADSADQSNEGQALQQLRPIKAPTPTWSMQRSLSQPHAADGSAYVYEGMRVQSVVLGLPRKAAKDVTIKDGDREIFVKAYHRLQFYFKHFQQHSFVIYCRDCQQHQPDFIHFCDIQQQVDIFVCEYDQQHEANIARRRRLLIVHTGYSSRRRRRRSTRSPTATSTTRRRASAASDSDDDRPIPALKRPRIRQSQQPKAAQYAPADEGAASPSAVEGEPRLDAEPAHAADTTTTTPWTPPAFWSETGRYRSTGKTLGDGTFGKVMKVRELLTGIPRARKRQTYQERPDSRLLFEVKALSLLQRHTGIVELLDVVHRPGKVDIIMPVYPVTLTDLLDQQEGRELRFGRARSITLQLLSAVAHIHNQGVAHLDLKPDNIFLTDTFQVKVGDFGLAQEVGRKKPVQTVGTVGYTAPECMLGSLSPSVQMDVWSIGCIVAEMLLGRPLFAFIDDEGALRDILKFTGHDGGRVYKEHKFPEPEYCDVSTSWGPYRSDARHRLRDLHPALASLLIRILVIRPNRRPYCTTLLQDAEVQLALSSTLPKTASVDPVPSPRK
ncbi:hypothetical protein V8E36_007819 [Tilletia maclaganii]